MVLFTQRFTWELQAARRRFLLHSLTPYTLWWCSVIIKAAQTGGEGEGEIAQKQEKTNIYITFFYFKFFHLGMWWLIMTLAILVGGETQLGKCQWEKTQLKYCKLQCNNDTYTSQYQSESYGRRSLSVCVCPLPGGGKHLLALFSWIRGSFICTSTTITHVWWMFLLKPQSYTLLYGQCSWKVNIFKTFAMLRLLHHDTWTLALGQRCIWFKQ